MISKPGDLILELGRLVHDVCGGRARRWVAGGTPVVDRLPEGRVVLLELIGHLLWRGGGRPAAADQRDSRSRPGHPDRDQLAKGPAHSLH